VPELSHGGVLAGGRWPDEPLCIHLRACW
jgi:hypothetical protein